jgi:hypothetical protein
MLNVLIAVAFRGARRIARTLHESAIIKAEVSSMTATFASSRELDDDLKLFSNIMDVMTLFHGLRLPTRAM